MNRIEWIDMAKGYGIICVIIGHITTPGITVWIYTFHIPLFFFLSGYLLHSYYSMREFLKRKVKSLLVPYFCLSILVIFHELFFKNGFDYDLIDVSKEVGSFIIQERHTPLWFIASLFWANLIIFLVYKFFHDFWLRVCIILFLSFVVYLYWTRGGNAWPWNVDIALFVLPFMMIAKEMHDSKYMNCYFERKKQLLICFFIFGNLFLGGINYYLTGRKVDLYYEDVDIVILTYLAAICGIFLILYLSQMKTIKLIYYIGNNSLLIFAWHLIVYDWLGRLYDYLSIFQTPLPLYMIIVRDFMSLFLILLILIPINEMILHSRFKFVLGRG
jgi:fucose 4-O-acetylase-like acetyltransferase